MELPEIQRAIEALPAVKRRGLLKWLAARELALWFHVPIPAPSAKPANPTSLQKAVLGTVLALLAFLLVDAWIFRSGWYLKYLEPNSSTGQYEMHLFWVRHTLPAKIPEVGVVGDSRIGEGFSARMAGAAVDDRIHFWNLGVGGTSPRAWYYFLRDADPDRKRFAVLAIALDKYSDQDGGDNLNDFAGDLNYLIGRLRLTDCEDFASSFQKVELRRGIRTGCYLKGVILRRDVQEFARHPAERLHDAKNWRNDGHNYIDGYEGKPESMAGTSVDFAKGIISFPPGLKDWQTGSAKAMLLPPHVEQNGVITAYRKLWLGRILDLYKRSATKIVFFELPRGPLPTPEVTEPARFLAMATQRPHVSALPQNTFRDLERPDWYADGLHLNRLGRPVFSERIGRLIREMLPAK